MTNADILRERPAIQAFDVALAIGVTLMTTLSLTDEAGVEADPVGYALLVVGAMALVWHRRRPLTVLAVAFVAHLAYVTLGNPEGLEWLPVTVALGSVTAARGWRWGVPLGAVLVGLGSWEVADQGIAGFDAETVLSLVGLGTAISVGEWLRTRQAYLAAIEGHAEALERNKEAEARRLVGEERLRIAREVHDVVAHALASISVQAGVGEHVGARDPERGREALAAIRRTSSEALDELRSILGALRVEGEHEVRPGIADVDRLVAMANDAGLDASVTVRGRAQPLPGPVDRAAYRIVQESVTNAIKHAGGARLEIELAYRRGELQIRVDDDGPGGNGQIAPGHGIVGMQERAVTMGGELQAGSRPDGGFRVQARLPVREPAT